MLFGISIVQLCASAFRLQPITGPSSSVLSRVIADIYHVSFGFRDHRFIQVSVYTIFLLDIFQSIVAANEGWQTLIAGWGRPENLRFPGWTFIALPIVSTIGAWLRSQLSLTGSIGSRSLDVGANVLCLEDTTAGEVDGGTRHDRLGE